MNFYEGRFNEKEAKGMENGGWVLFGGRGLGNGHQMLIGFLIRTIYWACDC